MVNAVGSLELPKILHARKNLTLALTDKQREILIGCVLGDAHIQPQGKICIEQSTHQKEYVLWKFHELKNLSYPAPPREIFRKDTRSGKEYHSMYFYLRQYFRTWRKIFYQGNKKVFPDNMVLTPLSLAVWYMDDGCLSEGKSTISIEGFDEESKNNVKKLFSSSFELRLLSEKVRN